jgi:preprotein translocase subunit SecG
LGVATYLQIARVVLSVALIVVILLQNKSAGLGGLTGGDYGGTGYHVRRGVERLMFNATIGLSFVFFTLAVLAVVLVH